MPRPSCTTLRLALPLLLWLLTGTAQAAAPPPPLTLEQTIPLTGVSGRIDHMAVDLGRKRLYVAELGNGTFDVIDLTTGKPVHRMAGLKDPQGVGYAADADLVIIANAGDGSVRLFHGADFSPAGIVDLGDDADNIRVDRQSGQVFVGYGTGGIATLNLAGPAVASRVILPAHPEGFQLDPIGHRVLVNLPDASQIAVIGLAAGKQVATWRVPGLRANFPMALDPTGLAAIAFRYPARLVLLDATNGAVVANINTCGDADDVFFDTKRQRIYVSCGEGAVDVLQKGTTGYRPLSRIETRSGARTSLFVPELDRLFVAARSGLLGFGSDAAILVFKPEP